MTKTSIFLLSARAEKRKIPALLLSLGLWAAVTNAHAVTPVPILDGFNAPTGIATAADGAIYISNWGGGSVERIATDGTRSVFLDKISSPAGIAVDASGGVFVASYAGDTIIRVTPDGARTQIADGLATPTGIAFTKDGRLLIANRRSGEVLSLDLATGERQVRAHSLNLPVGVVEMSDGSIVASQYGGRVTRILPDGATQELGQSFSRPGVGILADGTDAVLVIDNGADVVRRVSFDGQSQVVVDGMKGSAVALGQDRNGHLLVGTWGDGIVYRVDRPSR